MKVIDEIEDVSTGYIKLSDNHHFKNIRDVYDLQAYINRVLMQTCNTCEGMPVIITENGYDIVGYLLKNYSMSYKHLYVTSYLLKKVREPAVNIDILPYIHIPCLTSGYNGLIAEFPENYMFPEKEVYYEAIKNNRDDVLQHDLIKSVEILENELLAFISREPERRIFSKVKYVYTLKIMEIEVYSHQQMLASGY